MSDKKLTEEQKKAINLLIKASEKANQKGVFTLDESGLIFQSKQLLSELIK